MVLAFCGNKSLIYTDVMSWGDHSERHLHLGDPGQVLEYCQDSEACNGARNVVFFYTFDSHLVHTAAVVSHWLAASGVQLLDHPPYSPNLAPADSLISLKVKK